MSVVPLLQLSQSHVDIAIYACLQFHCIVYRGYLYVMWSEILPYIFVLYREQCYSLLLQLFSVVTHTHTHPFNGPFVWDYPGTRRAKPIWILLKHETVSGNGISWAICKSAPISSTQPIIFLQAGCPSCRPTNSVKALKAKFAVVRAYVRHNVDFTYLHS